MKLGSAEIEVKPMTWGTQKKVFKVITKGLATLAESKQVLGKMVRGTIAGEDQVPAQALADLVDSFPELLSEVLVVGIGITSDQLDKATGPEVLALLEAFVEVNDLVAQFARAKKAFTLLAPAEPQGESEKAGS